MKQVLQTQRICFVEVSRSLIEDYLVMVNNVSCGYRDATREPFTLEQEVEWVECALREGKYVLSMIEGSSGQFVGNIELMDVHDGEGELGIALTPSKQNMGYGCEGIPAFVAYAKAHWGINRIFLRTSPTNARAIHVYRKCGFVEYRRTPQHVFMELR